MNDSGAVQAVGALLSAVGITRVIVVDDAFEPTLDNLIAAGRRMPEVEDSIAEIGRVDFAEEPEIWQGELRERWGLLGGDQRRRALEDLRARSSSPPTTDPELGRLRDLMASVDLTSLTPAEFHAEFDVIVQQAASDPTLVLLDRHLGDGDTNGGIRLATALYTADPANTIWAGLLTNTVQKEDEGQAWDDLSNTPGIRPERFILLSKTHLAEDASSFVEALRVVLMARPSSRLQRAVAESVSSAVARTQQDVSQISSRVFERIVFGLARDEGVWEVDILLRLFDTSLRQRVRTLLYERSDVRESVHHLRELDRLQGPYLNTPSLEAQEIYHREVYEDADYLSHLHLPVELGDLFEKEKGRRQFVLVAQPCDLMVRNNGSGRREPELSIVTLLPVRLDDPNAEVMGSRAPRAVFELPAFAGASPAWIELDRPAPVPVESLDYCVFNKDGRGFAPFAPEIPDWILPAWAERGSTLAEEADKVRTDFRDTSKQERVNRVRLRFGIRKECEVTPFIEGENFNLGLRRVGRVRPPFARALLTSYSAHQVRADFDRPLVEPLQLGDSGPD